MADREDYPEDHRAKIRIGAEEIHQLLGLPDGLRIRAIDKDNDPLGFVIYVEGEALPPVVPDCESPWLSGRVTTSVVIHDRKPHRRWDWKRVLEEPW